MPEIFDSIELWADTHQFVTCCLIGFVIGAFWAIDEMLKPRPPASSGKTSAD